MRGERAEEAVGAVEAVGATGQATAVGAVGVVGGVGAVGGVPPPCTSTSVGGDRGRPGCDGLSLIIVVMLRLQL